MAPTPSPVTTYSLLRGSLRVYSSHFVPILIVTGVLLLAPFTFGQMGWLEVELITFYLTLSLIEAAMALGALALCLQPLFPAIGILKQFGTRYLWGALHIAILQYLAFAIGSRGMWLPFPMNLVLTSFWMISIYSFSLAQPIFISEGSRGITAFIASFKLTREHLPQTLAIVTLKFMIPLIVFNLLLASFPPKIALDINDAETLQEQLAALFLEIRWMLYVTFGLLQPLTSLMLVSFYLSIANDSSEEPEDDRTEGA